MKNNTNSKGFVPIIIILIVLSLIAGAYYFGTLKNKSSETSIYTPESTKPSMDLTADWKTYITKDGVFSFKYPTDWNLVDDSKNVDLYNDGKLQFQQNITISKGEYKFTSYNPLAWGPSACVFPDGPEFEGSFIKFDEYTEVKGMISTYRRAKRELPTEVKADNQGWTICSQEMTSETFVTVAWFGTASYQTPLNYDQNILKIMDQILASLKTLK
jgi:hypothetical protein